ncbi:hypothetical protein CUMW_048590 [Citrus unshiu]|nr:hypothetical protein CUMW_048590 [Citrus unshiu]
MAVVGGGTLSGDHIKQVRKKFLLRARTELRSWRGETGELDGRLGDTICRSSPSRRQRRYCPQIQSLPLFLASRLDAYGAPIAPMSQRDPLEEASLFIYLATWHRINLCVVSYIALPPLGANSKVEQVAEEAESLKESLDKYFLRNQRRINEARERAELLGRANGESSHILRIFDEEAQAMQSVRNSSRMLQESFATGTAILAKYAEQREHLKKAQRKALDVLNTVGLSNSVLRLIERRNRVDTWIKYVGMVSTVVILYFFWRWTR